jgi:hypothetical protein
VIKYQVGEFGSDGVDATVVTGIKPSINSKFDFEMLKVI